MDWKSKLDAYGFRKLSQGELDLVYNQIKDAVIIGLERKTEYKTNDGGVLAIPTKAGFIDYEQWQNAKYVNPVIVCNYGGTNWVTGLRQKSQAELLTIGEDVVRHFDMSDRKHSFDEFITFMKIEIARLDWEVLNNADTIAMALGFAQKAEVTEYGLDSRVLPAAMTKHWEIIDMHNLPFSCLVGRALIDKLNDKLPKLKNIYIRNDAEAIGDDVRPLINNQKILPITLVAGTGLGIVLAHKKDEHNVNLEIGRAVIKPDTFGVIEHMYNAGVIREPQNIIEYHIGGDFIKSKVLYALKNLAVIKSMSILENLFDSNHSGDIVSRLAQKEEEFYLPEEDVEVCAHIARAALLQAGQLIACAYAAVIEAAGYNRCLDSEEILIPTDGSILHKAVFVMHEFKATLEYFIEHSKMIPLESSGLDGIAKFAIVTRSS